jgi:hypothetical protein
MSESSKSSTPGRPQPRVLDVRAIGEADPTFLQGLREIKAMLDDGIFTQVIGAVAPCFIARITLFHFTGQRVGRACWYAR